MNSKLTTEISEEIKKLMEKLKEYESLVRVVEKALREKIYKLESVS